MSLVNTKKDKSQRRIDIRTGLKEAIRRVSGGLLENETWLCELLATQTPPPSMMGAHHGHVISIDA